MKTSPPGVLSKRLTTALGDADMAPSAARRCQETVGGFEEDGTVAGPCSRDGGTVDGARLTLKTGWRKERW